MEQPLLRARAAYSLSIFSAIIYALAYWFTPLGYLLWISQTPFVAALILYQGKCWKLGAVYGLAFGIVAYLWAPEVIATVTGHSFLLPWLTYLVYIAHTLVFPLMLTLVIGLLMKRRSLQDIHWVWLLPALWVVMEWLKTSVGYSFPWTQFTIGYRQANNLLALQMVSVTGIWGLSFCIMLTNVLLALYFIRRHLKWLAAAVVVILIVHSYGWIALKRFESRPVAKTIKTALIVENVKSVSEWNDTTGDSLVQMLFDLNRQAARDSVQLVLWSETALPWVLQADDQFIPAMLEITWPVQAHHVLGMNTPAPGGPGMVYNSALYIQPDGRISDKYDKQHLLIFFEKPVTFWGPLKKLVQHRYRTGLYDNVRPGIRPGILQTDLGLAGIRICNEWMQPKPIRSSVAKGAEFLLNMSNNGYFRLDFSPHTQWTNVRVRAVENRRDVAVACNTGYSGHISASGRIIRQQRDRTRQYIPVELAVHRGKTFYTRYGDWLPVFCIIYIILYFLANIFTPKVDMC